MLDLSYCEGGSFGGIWLQVTHTDERKIRTSILFSATDPLGSLDKLTGWLEGRCEDPNGWIQEHVPKLVSDAMRVSLAPPQNEMNWASTVANTVQVPTSASIRRH